MAKTNRDVVVFFCIANVFDLLLSSKDVYSFKCLFANNLNQYITSWSKSPFRWLNGNESISWRHRKCFSKLCVHRMRTIRHQTGARISSRDLKCLKISMLQAIEYLKFFRTNYTRIYQFSLCFKLFALSILQYAFKKLFFLNYIRNIEI